VKATDSSLLGSFTGTLANKRTQGGCAPRCPSRSSFPSAELASGTPDRIIAGLQNALRGAFSALLNVEDDINGSFRARCEFAKDGSFNLAVIPGDIVRPAAPEPPVDDPQVTAQEVARKESERRRLKAERDRLGLGKRMVKPPGMDARRDLRRDYVLTRAEELRALASSSPWTLSDLAAEFHPRADLMARGHDEITAAGIVARRHLPPTGSGAAPDGTRAAASLPPAWATAS
jgi:hypothetical protein